MSIESISEAVNTARSRTSGTAAYSRLVKLFDDGIFTELDTFAKSADDCAEIRAGRGTVGGTGVFAYAQSTDVSGGAMSRAQAAKIKKIYDLALKTGSPVVAVYDSVGGRLNEGSELLGAYGDVLKYSANLSGVVPQISVVVGKCCGTQALIAVSGDIVIMSENAELTINTDGSDASADKCSGSGIAHLVTENEDAAIEKAREIISLLPANNLDYAGTVEFDDAQADADLIRSLADGGSVIELQADFGKSIRTALATVEGATVGFVKTEDKILDGKGCSKAARFVKFCDAFGIPVVTLLDAEKFSCIRSAAKLSSAYSEATAPKVTIVTGDAYGAVYIALAGTGAAADMTFAWESASISALTPEAAAVIDLGDDLGGKLKGAADPKTERARVIAEYKQEKLTALKAAENGYVEDIITPAETRMKLIAALDMLSDKRSSTLPKKHTVSF